MLGREGGRASAAAEEGGSPSAYYSCDEETLEPAASSPSPVPSSSLRNKRDVLKEYKRHPFGLV